MPRKRPRPSLDDLWVLYPAILFGLPNRARLGNVHVAPESILLVLLLFLYVGADFGISGGARTLAALKRVPWSVWCLLAVIAVAWIFGDLAGPEPLLRLALWAATFYYAFLFARAPGQQDRLFTLWSLLALAGAAVVLLSPSRWGSDTVEVMAWQHRTTFAYFLVGATLFYVARLLVERSWSGRVAALVPASFLGAVILLTFSRGAWMTFLFGMLFLLVGTGRRRSALSLLGVTVLAGVLFVGQSESAVALRVRSLWDFAIPSSSLYRLDLLSAALRAIPDVGPWGVGLGGAAGVLGRHTRQVYPHFESGPVLTDSDFVWLFVEAGPLSAVALALVLLVWGVGLYRTLRRAHSDRLRYPEIVGVFTATLGLVTFDNVLSTPLGWFLLGFGLGAHVCNRERLAGLPGSTLGRP